ncbi:MAG: Gfo/Idh/MocA family oxidoreductase [Erysipelotrichaceae bacterium]|nr:Gfo/Idh/MocA family oxidoreductase [Erysipelotrichaceae bacterium]
MKLGILGTGVIVQDVLSMINKIGIEKMVLLSTKRSEDRAKDLVEQYHLDGYYLDYEELLNSDVDTIYIGLPNYLHYEFGKKALEHHKHVIMEKPFTANTRELNELIKIAKENHLIMVEAVNIHHLPIFKKLKEEINRVGDIKIISFNYSQYSSRYDRFKQGIIENVFDYHKAGGALMDLNLYNLHGLVGLVGKPDKISYVANVERGIDTSGIVTLEYPSFKAICIGAKDCKAPLSLTIQGDLGAICMNKPLNSLDTFTFVDNKDQTITFGENMKEHRLYYEFVEFNRIINELDYETAEKMMETTKIVSEIIEEARKQAGIIFDNDKILA